MGKTLRVVGPPLLFHNSELEDCHGPRTVDADPKELAPRGF